MAASGTMTLLVDDLSDAFNYTGGSWSISDGVWWMGGSQSSFVIQNGGSGKLPDSTETGTFSFTFNGTSVAFVGETPMSTHSQPCVYIDGGDPIYLGSGSSTTYEEWFQSPVLAYGEHTVLVTNFQQGSVDFATVTVPEQESIPPNSTLIYDDYTPSAIYVGTWTNRPASSNNVLPYFNTSHFTSDSTASFSLTFSGTSIALYGLLSSFVESIATPQLSLNYTIDGGSLVSASYGISVSGPYNSQPNFLLFQSGVLEPGQHTLEAQIVDCSSETFTFDYFTVTPFINSTKSPTTSAVVDKSHATRMAILVPVLATLLLLTAVATVFSWGWWRRRRHQKKSMQQLPVNMNAAIDLVFPPTVTPFQVSSPISIIPPKPPSPIPSTVPSPIAEKLPTYLPHYGDCQELKLSIDGKGGRFLTLAHRDRTDSMSDMDISYPSIKSPTIGPQAVDSSLSSPGGETSTRRVNSISKAVVGKRRTHAPRVSVPPPYQEYDPTAYDTDEEVPALPPSFKTVAPLSARARGFQIDGEVPPLPTPYKTVTPASKVMGFHENV